MADVATVLKDPNFHALPIEERRKVMVSLDSNFGGLPAGEQDKVLGATAAADHSPDALTRFRQQHPALNVPFDFLEGVGSSALSLVRGASQIAHHVIPAIPELPAELAATPDSIAGKVGNFAGMLATPIPGGAAAEGASLAARAGRAALQGAGFAALSPTDGKPEDFWTDKAKQIGTGAVVAPAVAGAVNLAGKGVSKVLGKVKNAGAVKLPAQLEADAAQANTAAEGTAAAANTTAQKRATAQATQAEQQAANTKATAQTAATNTVKKLKGGMEETAWGSLDDVGHAAQNGDESARQLLTKLENAGSDPGRIHEASIDLSDFRTRQVATGLYDKVQELVEKKKLPEVPLTATNSAVNRLTLQAKAAKLPDKGLNSVLKQIKDSTNPAGAPPSETAVSKIQGQWGITTPTNNSYRLLRELDSDLGERIRTKMSGDGALIGEKGVGQLQAVKDALRTDLDTFTQKSGVPEIQAAAQAADEFYKNARVPFKNRMIANAGSGTTDPDQIFKTFIQAGKGDRAQRFYDALDPKGQAAVQYSMVAKAMNDASDNLSGTFDHGNFFKSMDSLKDAYGVFFQGADQIKLEGLKKLMQQAAQADENVAAVRTLGDSNVSAAKAVTDANVKATAAAGKASVDAVNTRLAKLKGAPLGTATLAGVGAAEAFGRMGMPTPAIISGGIAGIAGLTKALMTTDAGKRFLLAASTLPVGPRLQKVLDTAMQQLPAAAARASTSPSNSLQDAAQRQQDATAERKAKLMGSSQ